jgi:hypothetical protein
MDTSHRLVYINVHVTGASGGQGCLFNAVSQLNIPIHLLRWQESDDDADENHEIGSQLR